MNVGVAGLGKMGAAMASRLIEVGHQVTVWNRTANKTEPLVKEGAVATSTPAELASRSDVIITILTDSAAIDSVFHGPSGLLSGDVRGKLFIEMSTVQPHTEVALAEKVRAKGAAFVECPVGGTTGPARQGKLIGLAGGSNEDFARAKPILEQLCRRIEHCGEIGAGSSMKLTINLPLVIYWQALGEALAVSRHLGFDHARMMDLLADTSGGTNAIKNRGPALAKMLGGDLSGAATFNLDDARKDLRTMLAEGKSRGIELPLIERTLACFDEASKAGWGQRDGSSQAVYWSQRRK
ncbi:MAG: NAD(P)-dependent oxidoreductase [Pseudorhodoplanes sp.]|jgi:3-hydroxyisobutyrate dehydrogenase|nr:NAD(P)-dependent oxidoreductase [Pseudorhodoplanes sp.]